MRKQSDIRSIDINTQTETIPNLKPGTWCVCILYRGNKMAEFYIDPSPDPLDGDFDMLDETFRCIKLQLASKQ